jgi:hypothetical protein
VLWAHSCAVRRGWGLAGAVRRVQHLRMPPDPGCYEERYRLTGRVALSLAPGLLFLALGIFLHLAVPQRVIALAVGVVLTLPIVIGPASRKVAFRADHAGITLGADLFNLPFRLSAVLVPWADAERIILYPRPGPRWGDRDVQCIGIQRRQGAPPLSRGSKPAPGCPVPGVAAGAARRINTWRLDRQRLAAVTAAVAPGVPLIDTSTGPAPML